MRCAAGRWEPTWSEPRSNGVYAQDVRRVVPGLLLCRTLINPLQKLAQRQTIAERCREDNRCRRVVEEDVTGTGLVSSGSV